MSLTSVSALPIPISGEVKKKRVLLVDALASKRDIRAEVMRKLGIDVDCAADIPEARSWWKADLYDLVLINVENSGHRDKFCEDMRNAVPRQQLAYYVGKPSYLADSPNLDGNSLPFEPGEQSAPVCAPAAPSDGSASSPQRWGILEASRKISAVRSLSAARARAVRETPAPPRDSDARPSKRTTPSTLDDLLRKELE